MTTGLIDLQDKVAIVTGAARGMGLAHARLFAEAGAYVTLTDVRPEVAEAAAAIGDRARAAEHDVRDRGRWDQVVGQTEEAFGRPVDILVNNAGVGGWEPIQDTSYETYLRVVEVNQHGVFHGMQAVLPSMRRAGGGAIVNISSIVGLGGSPSFAYSVSKWAVRGMTKSAAITLAADNIRVNSVHPGIIDTDMIADRVTGDGRRLAEHDDLIPLGRSGLAGDVSPLVAFLASDAARHVTGAEYVVDGGQTSAVVPHVLPPGR